MNTLRLTTLLLTLGCASLAFADDADNRTAKVTDRTDAVSQVSSLAVSNLDERFNFALPDDRSRLILDTGTIVLSIPPQAISSVQQLGRTAWSVKYQSPDGEATVTGTVSDAAMLDGNSDFGSFNLRLIRLKRLEFAQPGVATKPAKRPNIFDKAGRLRPATFIAILTLSDGTRLPATQLRRNEIYAQSVDDPLVLPSTSQYAVVSASYTDFRLLRGETLQTIPFENVKSADFMPDESVLIKTKSGTEAEMKLPRREEQNLNGFTGNCGKGDFYVPLRFVKSITFGDDAK